MQVTQVFSLQPAELVV